MLSDTARKLTMNGIAIPLTTFAGQGVDLDDVDRIELRPLGGVGSVQVAELGFQSGVFPSVTKRPKRCLDNSRCEA
jgi:hypothetical protein